MDRPILFDGSPYIHNYVDHAYVYLWECNVCRVVFCKVCSAMVFNHLRGTNFLILFMIYLIDVKTICTHIYWCMYILKIWYRLFFIKQCKWITKYIQYSHQNIYNRYNLLHEVIFKGNSSLVLHVLEWYCKYNSSSIV